MVQAEFSPSESDGEVAAGAEAESARIVELLKERRGGKSLPFGDSQLAAVAEEMVSDGMSAAMLRENALGDASMVDAVSPYFASAMDRTSYRPSSRPSSGRGGWGPPRPQEAPCRWPDRRAPRRGASRRTQRQRSPT